MLTKSHLRRAVAPSIVTGLLATSAVGSASPAAALDLAPHVISLAAQAQTAQSDENAALALTLSPLDPLRYAMLAVRAVNALLRGDHEAAAELGERAARSPGAHKLVVLIAALGTQAAGRRDRAAQWMRRARELDPELTREMFLRSFPFAPSAGRELIEKTLRELRL